MTNELEKMRESGTVALRGESGLEFSKTATLGNGLDVHFDSEGTIEDLERFEETLSNEGLDVVPALDPYCVKETLCNGLYFRALMIPKNMVITGRMHKAGYIDVLISGDVTVESYLSDGSKEKADRYRGFHAFDGVPGRKRILHTHEDTLWITVDRSEATNVEDGLDDATCAKASQFMSLLMGVAV